MQYEVGGRELNLPSVLSSKSYHEWGGREIDVQDGMTSAHSTPTINSFTKLASLFETRIPV